MACKLLCAISPCGELAFTHVDHPTAGNIRSYKKVRPAIADLIKPYFEKNGDRKWLFEEEIVITFKEALDMYEAVGRALRGKYGIKVGESVGVCMRNTPEYMLAFCAVASAGMRIVTLNSLWKTEELEYAVKDSDCKMLFCDEPRMDLIIPFAKDISLKLVLVGAVTDQAKVDAAGGIAWKTVVDDGKGEKKVDTSMSKFEDDAMIMYTSGSTGKPKGVVHSQLSLGSMICVLEMANFLAADAQDAKTFMSVPLFHITGIMIFLASFISGQQMHFLRKWDAKKAIEMIQKHGITRFTGVPTMARDMLEHPDFSEEKFATVKSFGGGGQAMPPELMARMQKVSKGGQVQGYGLTETCGVTVINRGADTVTYPDSTGKAIPFIVQLLIKDPKTGKVLPAETRGEICLKCCMQMTRYHGKADATKEVIDEDGFFHTGDIGMMRGKFLYIMDRLKDIIIRGGENIDCTEVENQTYNCPLVREVSVFGLPDKRLGEVVGMAVYPKDPNKITEPEEIYNFLLKSGMAKFKVPAAVNIFISDTPLPQGATGKIDKKLMRESYSEIVKARPEYEKA